MNIILTSECNKHCSFCFAKEYTSNPEKEIFDFDFLKKIISEMLITHNNCLNFNQIKLLGGEPTRYPKFIELMDWLKITALNRIKSNQPMPMINIISNFLFENNEILESIKEYIDVGTGLGFLLNISEMTQKQKEIVRSNLLYLISSGFKNTSLSFGFTINLKLDFSYYENILNFFKEEVVEEYEKLETKTYSPIHIRLSLANPEHNTVKFNQLLENKELYSKIIMDFVSWGRINNIKVRFDCGIYKCLFTQKDLVKILDWSDAFVSGCGGSAFDFFPTGDMINCYPTSHIKSNYYKYNDIVPLCNEVELKHKIYRAENEYPDECKSCDYFMKGCNGPCSGYL